MKHKYLINKIKSSYIINDIFNYVNYINFKLKLFMYSKFYQNKFDLRLINYKEKYIDKIGFDINNIYKYLHNENGTNKRDYLIKKYNIFY